jgi:hypothetical protein
MFAVFPAPYVAVVGGLTTLSFRSSDTSTAATIVGPADIEAGDILILSDLAVNKTGVPTEVVPTGFSIISSINDVSNIRQILSYKIADGSEASASLTGMDGNQSDSKILAVFQGDVSISSVTVQDVNGEMTDGNPTAQVKDASGGLVPLIVLGAYASAGGVNPRTWTGGTASELSQGTAHFLLYEIFNSSPADITIDMDDEGSDNGLQSSFVEAS